MKRVNLLLLVLFSFSVDGVAQATIDDAVREKRFTIQVESISPRRGGLRRLTSLYTFTVTPDTIMTELPYIGRAYQAPMGTDDTGVKFMSEEFEYNAKPGKRGAWEVTLKLKDARNYPLINITIQPGGSASIRMTPVDREYISYTGTIKQ